MRYSVKGGIGDFLQCLPFMLKYPSLEYFVATHYTDAVGFFGSMGIGINELSLGQIPDDIEPCPRQLFFDHNPFKPLEPIFDGKRPVVGVHLGSSRYSLTMEERFGFPPKELPKSILEGIISPHFDFLIFGSPKELDQIGKVNGTRLVRESNIIFSLSRVAECSMFIGSDSAFKTMSSMLRIPTVVLMGDYKDTHRDSRFIEPYSGIISTFRYKDLTSEVATAINFCRKQLEIKCLVSQAQT